MKTTISINQLRFAVDYDFSRQCASFETVDRPSLNGLVDLQNEMDHYHELERFPQYADTLVQLLVAIKLVLLRQSLK